MHDLGRRSTLVRREAWTSEETCIVDVPDWDIEWQDLYHLAQPMEYFAGDVLRIECEWDNSQTAQRRCQVDADCPAQASAGQRCLEATLEEPGWCEPVDVNWGPSADEMCTGVVLVYSDGPS